MKNLFILCTFLLITAWPAAAADNNPIRIGVVFSNTTAASIGDPHKKALDMTVAQINAAGGILNRSVELLHRDDKSRPDEATRLAEELIDRDKIDVLLGGYYSHIGLALSEIAQRQQKPYLTTGASTDTLLWEKGHSLVGRTFPNTYAQAHILVNMMRESGKTKWAFVTVNAEWGQTLVKEMKAIIARESLPIQFVAEQWAPLNKIEAAPTLQALVSAKPEAVLVAVLGPDLNQFVLEARKRKVLDDLYVIGHYTGMPEFLGPLGDMAPEGWHVTGYNPDLVSEEPQKKFVADFRAQYNAAPTYSALSGAAMLQLLKAAAEKAGTLEAAAFMKAYRALKDIPTAWGNISVRQDGQALTTLWSGILRRDNAGRITMQDHIAHPIEPFGMPVDRAAP